MRGWVSRVAPLLLLLPFAGSVGPTPDTPLGPPTAADGAVRNVPAPTSSDAEAFQADLLVDEARACEEQNECARALILYSQALAHNPADAAAAAGRAGLVGRGGKANASVPAPPDAPDRMRFRREVILWELEVAVTDGESALANGDVLAAQDAIGRACSSASESPSLFSLSEIRRFNARLTALHLRVIRNPAALAAVGRRAAGRFGSQPDCWSHCRHNREATVANLTLQARQLTDAGICDEAIWVVDQILVLDPDNDYALGMRPMLESIQTGVSRRSDRRRSWRWPANWRLPW